MSDKMPLTRRSALEVTATALGTGLLSTTVGAVGTWTTAATPTSRTLHDVQYTIEGAYAVGNGGVVLERDAGTWSVLIDDGPSGNGDDLYGAGVTDDGERLWFVGASGAVGEFDVVEGTLHDYSDAFEDQSAPDDYTGNFNDVVATGDGGEANVFISDDSGIVHYSFDNGDSWEYVTPGSGSTIPALDFYDDLKGHAADTNQTVIGTTDGENWTKIGIEDVDENFYGVDSDGSEDVWVCGGRGKVFDYDGSWSITTLGDVTLRDITVTSDDTHGYTVGSGGRVFAFGGAGWSEEDTPTDENLEAVVRGNPDTLDPSVSLSDGPDIAVGAGGTVIEK